VLRTPLSGLPVIQVAVVVHAPACTRSGWTSVARAAEGIGVLSGGEEFGVDGGGKFTYLDMHAALGMIVEVIEPPTSLGEPARRL
jgi:hypothetical protein